VITLRAVAALYLISGLWCAAAPQLAAGFLGFGSLNEKGLAEFFTVYGGLQTGLAVAMAVVSLKPLNVMVGLLFAAVFSSVLALFRLLSLALYSIDMAMLGMAVLEVTLAIVLWSGWLRNVRKRD
jgi:glycerol-3-phosphate acyltransferase PlsY